MMSKTIAIPVIQKIPVTHKSAALFGCKKASTAVEFALIAPLFLIMVIGVFEMSRAMWIKASMQFAVEETARYAIVNSSATASDLTTYAAAELSDSGMNISGVTFAATLTVSGSITYVDITGSYAFSSMVPLVPFPDVTLTSKSRVPTSS